MRLVHYSDADDFDLDVTRTPAGADGHAIWMYPEGEEGGGWPNRTRYVFELADALVPEPYQEFERDEFIPWLPQRCVEIIVPAALFAHLRLVVS